MDGPWPTRPTRQRGPCSQSFSGQSLQQNLLQKHIRQIHNEKFWEKNVLDGNDRTINLGKYMYIFFSQKILLTVLVLEALFIGRVGILK